MPVPRRFDRDAICALLDRGDLTYQQIAAQIGCSTPLVGHVARGTGRGRGKAGAIRRRPARLYDRAEIRRLLDAKPRLSYREIADRVGCSEGTVGHVSRAAGHKRNHPPQPRGPEPQAQDKVLATLRAIGPSSERRVSEAHGYAAWRVLDALRRRGLVTCDRTKRPHVWRVVERTTKPGVLEVVSEITAQIVRGSDGRRYLMIPWEHDLRDA